MSVAVQLVALHVRQQKFAILAELGLELLDLQLQALRSSQAPAD